MASVVVLSMAPRLHTLMPYTPIVMYDTLGDFLLSDETGPMHPEILNSLEVSISRDALKAMQS